MRALQFPQSSVKVQGDYTCEICGESFETNVEIAAHTVAHKQSLSKDELVSAICELASKKGRAPTRSEMDEEGKYSSFPAVKKFGSWNEALRTAGLEPNLEFELSDEAILDEIHRVAEKVGGTPTTDDIDREARFSVGAVTNSFDSWNKALYAADLSPNVEFSISNEDIIKAIRRLGKRLNRPPTAAEMGDIGEDSTKIAQQRFGSWNDALREAGYEPHVLRNIAESELLSEIDRVVDQLGYIPSTRTFEQHSRFSMRPYHSRYGTWENARQAAGHESPIYSTNSVRTKNAEYLYYGPNWPAQRKRALERDNHQCQTPDCEFNAETHLDRFGCGLAVHHIIPLRSYIDERGNIDYERANALRNLVTVCQVHHKLWERMSPLQPDIRYLNER